MITDGSALQYIFNALIGGKQTKRKQYFFAFYAELIFIEAGIDKRRIRNAVMDKGNFLFGNRIDIFKEIRGFTAHHHQFVGTARLSCP